MRACSTTPNKTPEEICEILSPSHLQEDCISLGNYLSMKQIPKYDNLNRLFDIHDIDVIILL